MAFPNGLSDLIEIFALQGINQAVICPGSRNAPIMLALTRNKNFTCYSISDERSAAFFGLGLAQKTKKSPASFQRKFGEIFVKLSC